MSITLRPFQVEFVRQAHEALRQRRAVCMVAPTGAGKRVLATWWAEKIAEKGRKILVVTNRRILVEQMADECKERGIKFGVIMANSPRNTEALVQVASLQTLQRRGWKDLPPADWVLIDECFVAETKILTPLGERRIDQIRAGDTIYCGFGLGVVQSVFSKPATELFDLEFSDGTALRCTGDHPIFTSEGWVRARDMVEGSVIFRAEDLRGLWSSVYSMGSRDWSSRSAGSGSVLGQPDLLLQILFEDLKESDEQQSVKIEDACDTKEDQASAYQARRERAIASLASACAIARTGGGMGGRAGDSNENAKGQWISNVLQDGPWEQGEDDRNRGGRSVSCDAREKVSGCQEAGVCCGVRLVRISRIERASAVPVFNLRVSGHPSYFANGILVHNCHRESSNYQTLFSFYPAAKHVGLTATPAGAAGRSLIGLFDLVVEPVKNSQLIADKWLLPVKVIAPSEPDVVGVSIQDGNEYNQKELGERVEECTVFADVFKWFEPYKHMKTIVFVPRVKFAYGLCEEFQRRKFSATVIEAGTRENMRRTTIQDFKEGEAQILISVSVLAEGFDATAAQCCIDLQPNNQFRSWWQKVGRIKRPHGDQKEAILLDFAGNYWRHWIHPDSDPPWNEVVGNATTKDVIDKKAKRMCPECGSRDIYKGRCQDCGHQCEEFKPPWVCPACSMGLSPWQRVVDGKCPNCGEPIRKAIRRIRMRDGKMRVVSAEELSTRKREQKSREQTVWTGCLMKAHYSKKTLDFARWLYSREMGTYPPAGLKDCPEDYDSGDWKMTPKDKYPWVGTKGKK